MNLQVENTVSFEKQQLHHGTLVIHISITTCHETVDDLLLNDVKIIGEASILRIHIHDQKHTLF